MVNGRSDAVTVIVPTRNRAVTLTQTLRSVLAQQDVSLTVVVVDDASTDETLAVVGGIPGIHLLHHEQPTEQRAARNHGASIASTRWLAFCDDDDLWSPLKLRKQLDAANALNADWCTSSSLHVDSDLMPLGGQRVGDPKKVLRDIYRQNVIGGCSGVLIRRSLFEDVGGFSEEAKFVEDWDLWIRLSKQGTIACVDELLVAYRRWSSSFSHAAFDDQYSAFRELTKKFANESPGSISRPRGTSAFEVKQRLNSESRLSIATDLPRLLRRDYRDILPVLLMMSIPDNLLKEIRLRKLGIREVRMAENWLSLYR